MKSFGNGPPIRTVSDALGWFWFELREVLTLPFELIKHRQWGGAAFMFLLWLPLFPLLLVVHAANVIRVVFHRDDKNPN